MDPAEGQRLDDLRRRILDAVAEVVAGTEWAPPEGGVLVDGVFVLAFMDQTGESGWSYVQASSSWATEGLLARALRSQQRNGDIEDGT